LSETTQIAVAALALSEALGRLRGSVREAETGLHVQITLNTESADDERLVRRIVDEVGKRHGVKIELELDWR
jgi:hypothetical protein